MVDMEGETTSGLLPIGRFSEMTRLSIKALRIYDEMELLRPSHVDPSSGYRYYQAGQANRAEAIRRLRGLEMPLDEIKRTLASSPAVANEILEAHRDRIARKLELHQRSLAFITDLMQGKEQLMPYEIALKETEDQHVGAIRTTVTLETIADEIGRGFQELYGAVMSQGGQPTAPPFIIFHDVIDEETSGDIEMCMPVATPIGDRDRVVAKKVAGGVVASTFHRGRYSEVGPAYHALSSWIADHGHATTAGPREIYLNDPTQVAEAELLTEVQWPIAPAQGSPDAR